jgi:hypothetical protein
MDSIKKTSGITKRLFLALQELTHCEPDLEGILFQLCAVVDSTAKRHYPKENSSKWRFLKYIDRHQQDLLQLSYGAKIQIDGFKNPKDGRFYKISEILYKVRCSSYHDPEELKDILDLSAPDGKIGFDSLGVNFAWGLFLLLWTDSKNKDKIHVAYFKGYKKFGLENFIGKRELIIKN